MDARDTTDRAPDGRCPACQRRMLNGFFCRTCRGTYCSLACLRAHAASHGTPRPAGSAPAPAASR